jgi:hypothetical protein
MKVKKAEYHELRVRSLKGNPLAEAIHPRLTEDEFEDKITNEIDVPDDIDEYADYEKELEALSIMKTVSPTSLYYQAYCDFYNVLMAGYMDRNPLSEEQQHRNNLISTGSYKPKKTSAECMMVTGLSGVGKSTLLDTIVGIFGRALDHSKDAKYGRDFRQIIYLKCDIPANAGALDICKKVLKQLDELTNENYVHDFKKARGVTVNDYIDRIIAACSTHGVGVVIFDEVQNISFAQGGDRDKIFRLMRDLTNMAKIPVINVGTTKAINVFKSEFGNIRRLGLPIDILNFEQDEEDWQLLVEYAWSYQLTAERRTLSESISNTIYQLTRGVPYCLFFLMAQANIHAIREKKTSIGIEELEYVYNTKFRLLKPALLALKLGLADAFDDIFNLKDQLEKNVKETVKKLFKIASQYKLQGEPAKELYTEINLYLPEYTPTQTEARILKNLQKSIVVEASDLELDEDGVLVPL